MRLDELARASSALGEEAFVRAYPDPALVMLDPGGPKGMSPFDTSSGVLASQALGRSPVDPGATDAFPAFDDELAALTPAGGGTVPAAAEHSGSSRVVFVAKGQANPFAQMITVGRAGNNDLCFSLSTVSKVHAYFDRAGEAWRITDQKSTNGTYVDERRLAPGGSMPLPDAARIGFGPDVRAKFFTPRALYGFLVLYRSGAA